MTTRFRILAGFGSVADEEPTIDTALMLARALEADIAGYFVEDTDLLNLAALPFAKAVRPTDRSVRDVELEHMQRTMTRAAGNWKRMLHASAGRARVNCSFETTRGAYSAEIARACATTDLVVVNPANMPRRTPDSVAGLLQRIREAAGTVLLPEGRSRARKGPLVLLATGEAADRRLFELTAQLATAAGRRIAIEATQENAQAVRTLAQEILGTEFDLNRTTGPVSVSVAAIAELRPSFILARRGTLPHGTVEKILAVGGAPLLLFHEEA